MWKNVLGKLKPAPPPEHAIEGAQNALKRTSSPALMRLKMIVKLSKILGKDVATLKGRRPRVVDTRARPAMQNRKNKLLKKMQVALGKKSKPKKPNKNLKDTKYWRKFVEQKPMPQAAWRLALEEEEPEPAEQEPEVQIPLNSTCISVSEEIIYNHEKGSYEHFREDDPLLNLLTIPSRIYFIQKFEKHEKENATKQPKYQEQTVNKKPKSISDSDSEGSDLDEIMEEIKDDSRRELEAMYQGQISKEELAKLDSQPNPFNFSDRVTQTTKIICKEVGMQTKPPPSTSFIENVGLGDIYHNYQEDYAESKKKAKRRKEEEAEKERGHKPLDPIVLVAPPVKKTLLGELCFDLASLRCAARVVERMVTQNIFDEVLQALRCKVYFKLEEWIHEKESNYKQISFSQTLLSLIKFLANRKDFKYFEDGSDEYKPMDGSLLPLWRFKYENSKSLIVSDICWSPIFPDLFAAAYIACEVGGNDGPGMLCVYSLKNPATPEKVFHAPCGVITIQFHPKIGGIMVGGWSDGTIAVYDICSASSSASVTSSSVNGKHLLPVTHVQWVITQPGEDLKFFSLSMDGRVTQWYFRSSSLKFADLLDFRAKPTKSSFGPKSVALEGSATCIAFCPEDEQVLLLGVDTGAVFQCSIISTRHSLMRYPAHLAPVREVSWNKYHHKVFLTCSLDWTVKIWIKNILSPLIVLDLGGAVVGVAWSPYSSSVIVAVTEECRVSVYDLFLRKCRPICVQSLIQKKRIAGSCVTCSPFYPIILVGGNKGHLVAMKLSPNLRKVHKDAKGADAAQLREIELCKIERLIATINR